MGTVELKTETHTCGAGKNGKNGKRPHVKLFIYVCVCVVVLAGGRGIGKH